MERKIVNNNFYNDLGEKWYQSFDHPVALLRAENNARIPWIQERISQHFPDKSCSLLDIGCGGGFLTNALAEKGHQIFGIDLSEKSLGIAQQEDQTKTVCYRKANAYALPFKKEHFNVVCAMDLLEHVEKPAKVIAQAARVLKPGGLFFFHTFNRNWLSWLFALKGVEWFIPNTPRHMHLYRLFIKPKELIVHLNQNAFSLSEISGLMPKIDKEFFKSILTRKISPSFSFKAVPSIKCGYMGYAIKAKTD